MCSNLILLLKRHINSVISEIFIKNLYQNNFQFINNIDLNIDNYNIIYYKGAIIILCIDIDNKEILNTINSVLNLKYINIYNENQIIKQVFIINIDTKTFINNNNCVKIQDTKLKINSLTIKNNKIYEIFISPNIYPQLIMIKDMIDKNEI